MRRNTKGVSLLVLGNAVAIAIATWSFATALSGPVQWYVLGVMHTGLIVGMLHMLNSGFLASDREAIWHVRGAWGEENTRSELQRAKRRRLIWDWVDSISFQAGDLDHMVVTRSGGLVAIDSKWRNEITRADAVAMAQSAKEAQRRAEALARTLLTKERGTHRARAQSLVVTPLVVVWGAAQRTVPHDAMVDGVRFLAGREFVPWLRTIDGDRVPKDAAKDVLALQDLSGNSMAGRLELGIVTPAVAAHDAVDLHAQDVFELLLDTGDREQPRARSEVNEEPARWAAERLNSWVCGAGHALPLHRLFERLLAQRFSQAIPSLSRSDFVLAL